LLLKSDNCDCVVKLWWWMYVDIETEHWGAWWATTCFHTQRDCYSDAVSCTSDGNYWV